MQYQRIWAQEILDRPNTDPDSEALKDVAEICMLKLCYHPSPFHGFPDLAREVDLLVYVYVCPSEALNVAQNGYVAVGKSAILATTIPPYRSDLSAHEVLRLHNLAWPRQRRSLVDFGGYIVIFASTLFFHLKELTATSQDGAKKSYSFYLRPQVGFRRYDVLACGNTRFSMYPGVPALSERTRPEPDVTLRL